MHNIPNWYYDSMPAENEIFRTAVGLEQKVDGDGRLKFFSGETTVFLLPETVCDHLLEVQERLYAAAGEMLSKQRLSPKHFHMTLHSFWDMASKETYDLIPYKHEEVFRALDDVRRDFPEDIMMRTVCPMNMASTSAVMGLAAATEEDGRMLREIHERISSFYPRPYGLNSHVTLAYYRPGCYPEEVWKKLKREFVQEEEIFPINTGRLLFQSFTNMDKYTSEY